jgi:hypothetical protein
MIRIPVCIAATFSLLLVGSAAAVEPRADAAATATVASSTAVLSGGAHQVEHLSLVVPADGRPVLAYFDAVARQVLVGKCRNPVCAGNISFNPVPGLHDAGAGLAMAIGANGHPVLSYQRGADMSLRVSTCQTADCAIAIHATIDDGGFLAAHTSIAVGADGRPLISYYDASSLNIRVARCADTICNEASVVVLDWYAAGPHSAAGIDPDGRPVIAFQDWFGAFLYARCDAPDCSAEISIHMVDGSAAGAGYEPTLRFAPDGMPAMSYMSGQWVTFARCTDAACSDAVVTSIEGFGRDGERVTSPSLALADGRPLISYRRSDGELKLAVCSDSECEAGSLRRGKQRASDPGTAIAVNATGAVLVAYVDSGRVGVAQWMVK